MSKEEICRECFNTNGEHKPGCIRDFAKRRGIERIIPTEYKPIVCYGCKVQTLTHGDEFDLPYAAGWNVYQNRFWCNVCSEKWQNILAEHGSL